ncbi:MAG: hypothetical protein KAX19_12990, partial [Candidatus Brocadiae bacterium]|nr:hypothetical protein [Candidatus Brocadiia bacterium]
MHGSRLVCGGLWFVLSAAVLALASSGVREDAAQAAARGALPRRQTLYVAGLQWGAPSTFNPIAADPDWPVGEPHRELLYETLFAFNMVTGDLEPLLAGSYRWTDDLTAEVSL